VVSPEGEHTQYSITSLTNDEDLINLWDDIEEKLNVGDSKNNDSSNNTDNFNNEKLYNPWVDYHDTIEILGLNTGEVNFENDNEASDKSVKDALFTTGTVWNKEINILVDSGSKGCVVAKHFLDQVGQNIDEPSNVQVIDITGQRSTPLGRVKNIPVLLGTKLTYVDMLVTDSKEYNVVLGNEYLDKAQAVIDYYGGFMSIGVADQIEYIPISCKQRIRDPNTLYPILYKNIYNNMELELELEEDNLSESTYTAIQIGNTFSQFEEQVIASVKVENIDNPLSPTCDDEIFKLVQPEINEIKNERKSSQKCSIPITQDKSTYIGNNLDKEQQQQITQLLHDNNNIFATTFSELGKTNTVYHNINTGDACPIK
jgi:hypothetical protein